MLGVTGGCEPEFALKFTRKTESLNNGEIGYYEVDCDAIREYRYITGKSDTPSYFVASADIKWKDRVDVQSIMQRHIDTAISSTVNLKKDCSLDDVEALYLYAWRKGIKGITIYRSGCKREGILTVKDGDSEYKYEELPRGFIEDVPEGLIYRKYKLKTGCGNLYFFVGVDEFDGKIYDCFTNTDGVGGCTINTQANSRLLSAALRGGVPVEYLVDQLNKSGTCPSFQYKRGRGEDVSKGKSCSSAIAFVLKDILEEFKNDESEDKVVQSISQNTNNDCPECGEKVIYEGGCNICKSCGWSKCS
jgi:ribonucleoside-diphosphate reductase alpha chain